MSDSNMVFEASAASMLSRQVSNGLRLLIYMAMALIALASCWAALSSIDMVVTAPAVLRPLGEVARVQSAATGTVASVAVQEGQQVHAGDVLVRLKRDSLEARLSQLVSKQDSLQERRRHLDAEAAKVEARGRVTEETHRQRIRAAEIALQKTELEHRQRIAACAAETATCRANLEMKQYRLRQVRHLAQQGATNDLELTEAANNVKIAEATYAKAVAEGEVGEGVVELAEQELQLARENASLANLEAQQSSLEMDWQLTELTGDLDRLGRQIEDVNRQLSECDITATISGTVVGLRTRHAGEVVGPGDMIATIVPTNVELHAEILVPDRDIAFIQIGQPVSIRLAALPHGQYGHLEAEVTEVSEDVLTSPNGTQSFVVRCRLAEQTIRARGRDMRMRPGMTAEASITTHRQSPLSLLTGKLKNMRGAI